MRILINCSIITKGGGIQVSHSLLSGLSRDTINTYFVVLSIPLSYQIKFNEFGPNFSFHISKASSLAILLYKSNVLSHLENKFNPDLVFTVFGPCYWIPKTTHLMGLADGWLYNPDSIVFQQLNFLSRFYKRIIVKYKVHRLQKEAKYYVTETIDAKNRINKYLGINIKNISVIGNSYNLEFQNSLSSKIYLPKKRNNEFRLLVVSANYPHKNIKIINKVIPILLNKDSATHYSFIITLKEKEIYLREKKNIFFLGSIPQKYLPSLYEQCDALFLPSLLETFSANYPEAMISKKPILTSDLSFASEICCGAAEYFNPLDENSIAESIIKVSQNLNYYEFLISQGQLRLKSLENPNSKVDMYLKLFNSFNQINS